MAVTFKQVKEALSYSVDQVSKLKNGNIIVRKGYFYRNGMVCDKFKDRIVASLTAAGIVANVVDFGDRWMPFRGGASVARQSHFYVELA